MKNNILFLKAELMERIWGGNNLRKYGYDLPNNKIGEAWLVSGRENESTKITNLNDINLYEFYQKNKNLFGPNMPEKFPLLIKLLDAQQNLSIQVHPDDKKAQEYNDLGKNECWLVLDCKNDSEIIIGHNAKNREELNMLIDQGEWDKLLRRQKIQKNDFFYIPAGTIHAICENTIIYEVQQSSDITYRLYDYDRIDENGQKRKLHIEKAKEVININNNYRYHYSLDEDFERLVDSEYFQVSKLKICEHRHLPNLPVFQCVTVLNGEGMIENNKIQKGDSFIVLPNEKKTYIEGNLELIISNLPVK